MDQTSFNLSEHKRHLTEALHRGDFAEAELWLRRVWKAAPSASLAAWMGRTLGPFKGEFCNQIQRVAFLRSFTVEPAVQLLQAAALGERIAVEPFVGQFNAYTQELLDPRSELRDFQPDVTFLCVLTRSIAPELWDGFQGLSAKDCDRIINRVCEEFSSLMDAFQSHYSGHLIVHTLAVPRFPVAGVADAGCLFGQTESIRRINRYLIEAAALHPGVSILDYGEIIRDFGASRWYDDARWESIRLPMTSDAVEALSSHWLRFLSATSGALRKVLVCDLDNTLWKGIVGEDGFDGIELAATGAGAAHRDLQRAILDLYYRGIILAVCSKNNHAEAWEVIERHPDMLLRPEHFAAVRINWLDKNVNLTSIAAELNVGIESLVFLDDNPHEQHLVRQTLPQVRVLDVGPDAYEYAAAVRSEPGFERLFLSQEDQSRGRMYAERRLRDEAQQNSEGLESYLHSLNTVVTGVQWGYEVIDRVAQLTQKTNQCNLTTKRYTSSQIAELHASSHSQILAYRVSDRFGDSGIVGVSILRFDGDDCEIDSLLLSCRVIGRGIETAMLFDIVQQASFQACRRLIGYYKPTSKNMPCADFYETHGFRNDSGAWILNLAEKVPFHLPSWLMLQPDQSRSKNLS